MGWPAQYVGKRNLKEARLSAQSPGPSPCATPISAFFGKSVYAMLRSRSPSFKSGHLLDSWWTMMARST